jgi:hypothetical protein
MAALRHPSWQDMGPMLQSPMYWRQGARWIWWPSRPDATENQHVWTWLIDINRWIIYQRAIFHGNVRLQEGNLSQDISMVSFFGFAFSRVFRRWQLCRRVIVVLSIVWNRSPCSKDSICGTPMIPSFLNSYRFAGTQVWHTHIHIYTHMRDIVLSSLADTSVP